MKRRVVLGVLVAVLAGCGDPQPPSPATSPAGATAAVAAPATSGLADRLWAADDHMKHRRSLADYQRKVAYLEQECTQQGDDLLVIVQRVHAKIRVVRGTGWYGALAYMASLSSGPQSDCSNFAAKA